jgi:hypothetical protein
MVALLSLFDHNFTHSGRGFLVVMEDVPYVAI